MRHVGLRRRPAAAVSCRSKRPEVASDQGPCPLGDGGVCGRIGPRGLPQDLPNAGRLARQADQTTGRGYLQPRASLGQRPACGRHEGGFTPFELDITDLAKPGGENEILVLVDARTMAADLDNASYFAYFELAGIWQPIEVFATSPTHVSHLAVRPTSTGSIRTRYCPWNLTP